MLRWPVLWSQIGVGFNSMPRKVPFQGRLQEGISVKPKRAVFGAVFNAAPVGAQLSPRILQDPACAAVGPI